MKTGRSTPTTIAGYAVPHAPDKPKEGAVPHAPDKPKEGSFKHKNRVLSPVNSGPNLAQLGSIETAKRVSFSIFTEVYYMDAISKEQIECFDSDEDLDLFHDEPVLDLSVFHRQ